MDAADHAKQILLNYATGAIKAHADMVEAAAVEVSRLEAEVESLKAKVSEQNSLLAQARQEVPDFNEWMIEREVADAMARSSAKA